MKKRYRLLPVVVAAAALASACSSSYDRDEFIAELEADAGLDTEQATCVVDGLEEKLGEDRLDDRGDLTAEEEVILTDLAIACLLGG